MKQIDIKPEREIIHDSLIKHILPLVGNHVTINQLDSVLYSIADEFLFSLQKDRERDIEKALMFAEWTNLLRLNYSSNYKRWIECGFNPDASDKTTEDLYNSQEFKDYIKQFEK